MLSTWRPTDAAGTLADESHGACNLDDGNKLVSPWGRLQNSMYGPDYA
jgi:hypothetical protein